MTSFPCELKDPSNWSAKLSSKVNYTQTKLEQVTA